jgi:hypothetical protein
VLTRTYQHTILNLSLVTATEAKIRPGQPLKVTYDPAQFLDEILILPASDQAG